jgi:predicted ABC-type exoprotein transport system permease subunit
MLIKQKEVISFIIVMNFVIAVAMLMTPMMVKSLVGGGLQSMSSAIGAATVAAMAAAPAKAAQVAVSTSRNAL